MRRPYFQFKQFNIYHDECAMKVGTDGVLIGAWANLKEAKTILDIGTGTGLIAIMAAQKNASAQITGIDIDTSACHQATKNVNLTDWKDRIDIELSSLQEFINLRNKSSFDCIVSNPPFFNAGTHSNNQKRQIARHTNTLSFEDLIKGVIHLLKEDGKFSIILPYEEGLYFQEIAEKAELYPTKILEVHSKKDKPVERLIQEFQKTKQSKQYEKLIIQFDTRNDWTPEYIKLTRAFYYKMP